MASILNATTTSGLVTSADNSGSLQLQTNNGTTAVTIDTSQNVGIGTTSPQTKLHVSDAVAGGQLLVTTNETNSTSKIGSLATMHYTNSQAPVLAISVEGAASDNIVQVGGGPGEFNASTQVRFFTAANNTTTGGTERMRITSGGDLLIGVTSGNGKVRIKQSADSHDNTLVIENFGNTNTWSFLVGSDNNLYLGYNGTSKGNFNNSTGAYTSTSDLRLKKNIETISHGLESVLALNPVSYNFKDETDESQQHLGFIAQEAQDILPSSVSAFADGTLGMDKQEIIPVLVKAIQELKAELDATKAEVQALKGVA